MTRHAISRPVRHLATNMIGEISDGIFITAVPKVDSLPHFSQTDFYVACSRAKHLLAVLLTTEGIV